MRKKVRVVMMKKNIEYYERLADDAEQGEFTPVPGTIKRGKDAAKDGQDMILTATGSSSLEEANRIILGRPRLGEKVGRSPSVNIRVTPEMREELKARAAREEMTISEVGRKALAQYLMAG